MRNRNIFKEMERRSRQRMLSGYMLRYDGDDGAGGSGNGEGANAGFSSKYKIKPNGGERDTTAPRLNYLATQMLVHFGTRLRTCSLKTIINRFINARSPLGVRIPLIKA